MAEKLPEIVQKLQQLARPTFVNHRWRKAAISGRELAAIRKKLVANGVHWPPKPLVDRGGEKPLKLRKHLVERPEKLVWTIGTLHDHIVQWTLASPLSA